MIVLILLFGVMSGGFVRADLPSCEGEFFGRIIAEPPIDDMGREFQIVFGEFLATHDAGPENLEDLAVALFELRLRLAQTYQTFFATQMEPRDATGQPVQNWRRRFEGEEIEPRFSFGIKGHPRAGAIWAELDRTLDPSRAYEGVIEDRHLRLFRALTSVTDDRALVWESAYRHQHVYLFPTFRLADGSFFLMHAADWHVPRLRQRARALWRSAFARDLDFTARVRSLAEFEWLWFWMNPFGRSGALTGDALSLLVQKAWRAEGLPVRMRTGYEFADLAALSRPLDQYVRMRVERLTGLAQGTDDPMF